MNRNQTLGIQFVIQGTSVTGQGGSEKGMTAKTPLTLQSLQQRPLKTPQDENDIQGLGRREGGTKERVEGDVA